MELISREQVIATIDSFNVFESRSDQIKLELMIGELPIAGVGTNLADVGTDCISREQAIEALSELATFTDEWSEHTWMYADDVYNAIKQLPPIQPKRGKWILDRSGAYCCSECMEPCAGYVMMKPRDKFCKMCGSRNEVTT